MFRRVIDSSETASPTLRRATRGGGSCSLTRSKETRMMNFSGRKIDTTRSVMCLSSLFVDANPCEEEEIHSFRITSLLEEKF